MSLQARPENARIILDGTTQHGDAVHWTFLDITETTFAWQGRYSTTDAPLELVQEMTAHRI